MTTTDNENLIIVKITKTLFQGPEANCQRNPARSVPAIEKL